MAHANSIGLVLLAHHQQDQAETFLLQALRGAGPAGLAAMPREALRDGIVWARPWLAQSPQAIDHYAVRHRLRWVDDPSNHDERYARSRLRMHVLPVLNACFEGAAVSLSASAQRMAQAQLALREVAPCDLATCTEGSALHVARWLALTPGRRNNALRAWLGAHLGTPPGSLIDRLMHDLRGTGPASWPSEGGLLRLHRGRLEWAAQWREVVTPPQQAVMLHVDQPGAHEVPPWGGRLRVDAINGRGVPLALLSTLTLRARSGGERFQRAPGTPPRGLKKQYQDADVPPWQRDGPLVYAADRLVFVPGLGLDARVCQDVEPGTPNVGLRWERAEGAPPSD